MMVPRQSLGAPRSEANCSRASAAASCSSDSSHRAGPCPQHAASPFQKSSSSAHAALFPMGSRHHHHHRHLRDISSRAGGSNGDSERGRGQSSDSPSESQLGRLKALFRQSAQASQPVPPQSNGPADPFLGASSSGRQQGQGGYEPPAPYYAQQGQQQQQGPPQPPARPGGVRALPEQDWGNSSAWDQDWDPMGKGDLSEATLDSIADEAEDDFRRTAPGKGDLRDTWITPLIDLQAIAGEERRPPP